MFAVKTTAGRGKLRRRPCITLFAIFSVAALVLGPGALAALGADPQQQPSAAPTQPATGNPGAKSDPKLSPEQQRIENVVAAAKQYEGVPYRVGSEGPSLFDCSGLVFRAFSDAGLVDRIGGARLRAAGYMRYFASRGLMTTDESQAQRGDLVIYNNGSHIGIYLGDGRAISALTTGVTVHSLRGLSLPVTGFLRPDWSGKGDVTPFVPVDLPDVPEQPASLVPAVDWMPTLDPALAAPTARGGKEVIALRTPTSRTFANRDGTFTTEFHAQPIFYQPAGTKSPADLRPVDLTFVAGKKSGSPSVTSSPVAITTRSASDAAGFVTATAGAYSISLGLPSGQGSKATPQIVDDGRAVDFFNFQSHNVGLRVIAQTDGFKTFLVLGKAPDRARFSFVLDAPGLVPVGADDGSIILTDASGMSVARIPSPLLLDSSDVDGAGGGVFTAATTLSVDNSGPAPVITVAVSSAFLDEAVMPAYVDLSLTEFPTASPGAEITFASSSHPNASLHGLQRPESPGFNELWLGHQPGSHNDNAVYVQFPDLAKELGTVDVASAQLELLPYFQRANDGVTVVRRVTGDWSADALTWAAQPTSDATHALPATSEAGSWSSLDVSSYVTDILSHGQSDYGLVLSGDTSSAGTWKRLAGSDAGVSAEYGPRLVVTWSGLRPVGQATAPASDSTSTTLTWQNPLLGAAQSKIPGRGIARWLRHRRRGLRHGQGQGRQAQPVGRANERAPLVRDLLVASPRQVRHHRSVEPVVD